MYDKQSSILASKLGSEVGEYTSVYTTADGQGVVSGAILTNFVVSVPLVVDDLRCWVVEGLKTLTLEDPTDWSLKFARARKQRSPTTSSC